MATASPNFTQRQVDLLEGEDTDLRREVAKIVADPDAWLDMPNNQLGGLKPKDLLGTPDENELRHLVRAIKMGIPT